MRKKLILGLIGILILTAGVTAGLGILHEEKIPDKALLGEYVNSILNWETVEEKVPKLAGYEVYDSIAIRGEESGDIILPPYSSALWISHREVGESGMDVPGGLRSFVVNILFYESEAAMEKKIRGLSLAGFELQEEDQVTIGFSEGKEPFGDGRDIHLLEAFVGKGRLWVVFTVLTYFKGSEGEPFAERAELEELVSLVKERLLDE